MSTESFVCQGLYGIQGVAARGVTYKQIGLDEISHLGIEDAAHAFSFQTLLLMQPTTAEQNANNFFRRIDFGCQLYNV